MHYHVDYVLNGIAFTRSFATRLERALFVISLSTYASDIRETESEPSEHEAGYGHGV
jgi:hypothetical protein